MGGSSRGNNGNSQRGKPYAPMLLLAFGAAILGVMILHKLREKRFFSVLVKEKDHQLLTLHLLFQREREFSKEARKKIEEMKTKVYSLRSQKLELERKVLEMESNITSLRDERKVIESALEEKKNEIKMSMEGRMNTSNEFLAHIASLKEAIKMKEAKIEDLKLQLKKSVNVNSGSDSVLHQISNYNSNPIMDEQGTQDESIILTVSKPYKLNDAEGTVAGMSEATLTEQGNTKQKNVDNGGDLVRTDTNIGNGGLNVAMEAMKISENESTKAIETSDDALNQESRGHLRFHRGGPDFEKSDGFESEQSLGFRVRRKHFKGKRWRDGARNRRLGHSLYSVNTHPSNEATSIQYDQAEPKTKQAASVDQMALSVAQKNNGQIGDGSEATKKELTKEDKGQGQRHGLVSDGDQDQGETDNEIATPILVSDGLKQKAEEMISNRSQAHEVDGKLEKMQYTDVEKHENGNEQQKVAEKEDAGAEDLEDAETHEPEIDKAEIQRFSESEEAEETEF